MPFVERHTEIIKKVGQHSTEQLWTRTIVFSLFIWLICFTYKSAHEANSGLVSLNGSFALAAMILIGLSFALSGLCYFWDFVDTKIIYRKYLGLVGFGFAMLHGIISSYSYLVSATNGAVFDFFYRWDVFGVGVSNVIAFSLGLIGLLIFIIMALISNKYAIHELGGKRWRQLLRTGYIAYVLAVFHFGIKKTSEWVVWFERGWQDLPPPSLPIVIFSLLVIMLRLTLWHAISQKKRIAKQTESSQL